MGRRRNRKNKNVPQPHKVDDERRATNPGALDLNQNGNVSPLIQPRFLGDFKTLTVWQRAIRATVDLETLRFMYSEMEGPPLTEVAEGFERTDKRDRAWMRAWLYYHGTLEHLKTYAQPMHWNAYGATWDEAVKRFGGNSTIKEKLSQLRYDRPLWGTTRREVKMATKEKKAKAKSEKAKEKAAKKAAREKAKAEGKSVARPHPEGPLGFRPGTTSADVAAKLLRKKNKTMTRAEVLELTGPGFIRRGVKRGVLKTDKEGNVTAVA